MTVPNPEAQIQEEEDISLFYQVSFERLEELNRSAITLLAARRGENSPSLVQEDHELDNPQELLEEITDYSAGEDDFISSDMPIQEIVFRMLLVRRNQPTALAELHNELTERWATPVRPINVSLKSLQRILDNDDYYGFARLDS